MQILTMTEVQGHHALPSVSENNDVTLDNRKKKEELGIFVTGRRTTEHHFYSLSIQYNKHISGCWIINDAL